MDQHIESLLIDEAIDNIANKTTSLGESVHRSETEKYQDDIRFEQEQHKLFQRLPSILLHSSELVETNSYIAVTHPVGPLIVTRDLDGIAHVFRNACRHRGAQIAEGKGCSKLLTCPYHAWSYSTKGELISVPGQNQCFPTLKKEENNLISLDCVEKYGFIWLCPVIDESVDSEMQLDSHLAGMASNLAWMKGQHLKAFDKTTKIWKGNWKLFVEGGLETYHFSFAHRETIASSFHNNVAVIDQLDNHFRVVMPTRALKAKEAERLSEKSLHDYTHTLFVLLPNSALLVQKEHVDWIQFTPLTSAKTEITVTTLIPEKADLADDTQLSFWQKNHHITNKTLDEDWSLGESIQRSIEAGGLPYIQYGKNEWALHAFNQVVESFLNR